jgi:hypothetical protein
MKKDRATLFRPRPEEPMSGDTYRYTLDECVPPEEAEVTLLLALIGIESLHGESQTRLDAAHAFNGAERTVTIDGTTAVGRDLNKLFAGFLTREFGADSFEVQRVERVPQPKPQPEPVTA